LKGAKGKKKERKSRGKARNRKEKGEKSMFTRGKVTKKA
jgi:hypothetical protein